MRRYADSGERRFWGEPRYRLENVTAGIASRPFPTSEAEQRRRAEPDDAALLERICAAYIKAYTARRPLRRHPGATTCWEDVRRHNLRPVMEGTLIRSGMVFTITLHTGLLICWGIRWLPSPIR